MADQEVRSTNFVPTLLAQDSTPARAAVALYADKTTHRLLVDVGTITTTNAAVGATGAAVPASADYIGVNSGGNLVGLAYGQGLMAASLPVTIASNQSTINVLDANFPTAVVLNEALAVPTAPLLGSVCFQWDGSVLRKVRTGLGDGAGLGQLTDIMQFTYNGTGGDLRRSVANATNSTGTGIASTGILAQFDDVSPTAITENSFGNLRMSANRNFYATLRDAAGNERGVNVTSANELNVLDSASSATAATVPTKASYAGFNPQTSLPSAATAGQLVGATADKFGRLVTLVGTIRDLVGTQTTTISASTSETTIVTAVASTFLDLMLLVVSNTSSATNTRIDFRDTTAGSILFSLQSIGGQPPIGFSLGGASIPQTTVNTNWTAQCASSTTDIRVYAVFAKNK